MHWTPGKCPQLRLQTCTAHFHSTQLDCLSHLTWLVKSYPSLLMGNMEGQKTKYNGPTHPIFFLQSSRYWTRRWQDRAGWSGCQRKRSCPEALIWRRKTSRSVHVMARAGALTVSHKRHWKDEKLEVAFAKQLGVKSERDAHPAMPTAPRWGCRGQPCPALP